jgi:BirA family biotin operon repressor/biotin-[acetyl-CoA-carboxylase] ligase
VGRGKPHMPELLTHARTMRQQPTPAERMLWQALQLKQIGRKWRRQAPIGPYIVDFYCADLRLVVEVDGATHADSDRDNLRDAWLRAQGFTILQLWNNDVLGNLPGVLQRIAAYPSSNPLPRREGAFSS